MQNTFKISVDLKKSVPLKTPIITEGDSVKFEVSVFDDGKVFDLSNSSRCVLLTVKPDGNVTAKNGSVVGTNKIEFNLGYLETGMVGKVNSIIQVYDLEGRVSSFPFSFIVKNDPSNDYVSKSPDTPLLQTLINDTQNLLNTLTQKSDYAKTQGDYAKVQGDYAKAQGDYAKTQGDYVKTQGNFANEKGLYAQQQGNYAQQQGDYAKTQGQYAQQVANAASGAAQNANDAAQSATNAANEANTAAQSANTAAASANASAENANTSATNAQTQADYAKAQGDYAKTQGDYAKVQGDYAKAQGSYAQQQGDYAQAKGSYAQQQGDYAKTQGDYAKTQGDAASVAANNANTQATNAQNAAQAANTAATNANNAANNANTKATYAQQQGDYAKTQGQYAQQVANENKTRWLTAVNTYANIATAYPNPQLGDTVQTIDDSKIYRWNGTQWVWTQQYNANAITDVQNKIGILNNELSKQNKQSVTIGHGLNIINASQSSPLDIQIEGRTLVNVSQNVLDATKYYVLADKKYKVKFSDGTTYTGVAKFQGKAEKPILIRIENFEGKTRGNNDLVPHMFKETRTMALQTPDSSTWSEVNVDYSQARKLDGTLSTSSTTTTGQRAQQLFSFNLIEAIERNVGKIPASNTAGKVAWLKNNIAKLTCNWWGYGQSPTGYKANVVVWSANASSWNDNGNWSIITHTNSSVALLSDFFTVSVPKTIDSNGFFHFLAYAEPSDGTTLSTICTDYVELEIELKPESQLWNPRCPLYEVDATEYANILTTWDENEVMRRYPMVESVQHVQNPYVIAEGENLLPPFSEWNLHVNASIKSPYELVLNATGANQKSSYQLKLVKGQTYTFSANNSIDGFDLEEYEGGTWIKAIATNTKKFTFTWNSDSNRVLRISTFYNSGTGTFSFANPMLTLGNQLKPFVPQNPSYLFAEVKLGAIGDKKDILWKDGQDWKVTKWIEKDYILDGKLVWEYFGNNIVYKNVKTPISNALDSHRVLNPSYSVFTKYDGTNLGKYTEVVERQKDMGIIVSGYAYMSIANTDSGWGETYTPSSAEIKAYFYGWRMCNGTYGQPYDGTGTKTWYPIGDRDLNRATTTCPTSAAPTIKEGKIGYYKLSYVRSTPVTEVVTDKVEGDLVVNGATQVEVGSGFTYTEVDGKRTYTKLAQNSRYNVTANILSVIVNYDTSLKSVVDSLVAKQSDIASTVSVNVRAISELYKRVKALGG